ncbi:hypothetical protein [Clostridioides difficile]|uniref:hypothetical protein n=1 Tax=Clostridioides difficile TaxID=1496 RepID=UPI003F8D0A68
MGKNISSQRKRSKGLMKCSLFLSNIISKFTGERDEAIGRALYIEEKEIAPIGVGTILKIIRK